MNNEIGGRGSSCGGQTCFGDCGTASRPGSSLSSTSSAGGSSSRSTTQIGQATGTTSASCSAQAPRYWALYAGAGEAAANPGRHERPGQRLGREPAGGGDHPPRRRRKARLQHRRARRDGEEVREESVPGPLLLLPCVRASRSKHHREECSVPWRLRLARNDGGGRPHDGC